MLQTRNRGGRKREASNVRERSENQKHGLEAPLLPRKPNFGTGQVLQIQLKVPLGANDTSAGIVVG